MDQPPAYMTELVIRAAALLQLQWPHPGPVHFDWLTDGKATRYIGMMEWPRDIEGPRTIVACARTGYFVCRSLPGEPFELDVSVFDIDTLGSDEIAHLVGEGGTSRPARSKIGGRHT